MHDLVSFARRVERGDVVAMPAGERGNFFAAERGLAAREHFLFRPGDIHDFSGRKFAFRSGDADGEQAAPLFAQHRYRAGVDVDGAGGRWKYASHRFFSSIGRPFGTKNVPGPRPASSRAITSDSEPLAMNTPHPARVASFAAVIFETMPPTAVSLVVPPAIASMSRRNFLDHGHDLSAALHIDESRRRGQDDEIVR